jgi:hypothetical protein
MELIQWFPKRLHRDVRIDTHVYEPVSQGEEVPVLSRGHGG